MDCIKLAQKWHIFSLLLAVLWNFTFHERKEFLGHLNDGLLFKEDSVPCNGSERKRNHGIFAQFQTNQILLNSSLLIDECNILD
jgi:hypothetical protein